MHMTINYSRYSEDVKRAEALKDCREWLSKKQWNILREQAKLVNEDTFYFLSGFAGIQGYPVTVLRTYFLEGGQ